MCAAQTCKIMCSARRRMWQLSYLLDTWNITMVIPVYKAGCSPTISVLSYNGEYSPLPWQEYSCKENVHFMEREYSLPPLIVSI